MNVVLQSVKEFHHKYPGTIGFRKRAHCKIAAKHLEKDETIKLAFVAQKNDSAFDIITSCVFVLTNKRLLMAKNRLLFGYMIFVVTPELFNDFTVTKRLFGANYILIQ